MGSDAARRLRFRRRVRNRLRNRKRPRRRLCEHQCEEARGAVLRMGENFVNRAARKALVREHRVERTQPRREDVRAR